MEEIMDRIKNFRGKFQYNSPVTLSFALLSLVALLLGMITKGFTTGLLFSVYHSSFLNPLTYIRLLGHVLGHSGWSHFSANMVLFLVLGPMLEEKYGSKQLVEMIIITAVVSGLFYMVFFPNNALLGASGIVFMMIVLSSAAGMKDGKIPITLLLVVVIYLGGEVLDSFGKGDGIAHAAHIVGGLCGTGFGFVLGRKTK